MYAVLWNVVFVDCSVYDAHPVPVSGASECSLAAS